MLIIMLLSHTSVPSPSCPLHVMREQTCSSLWSVTEFCFRRRITAPHESTERDASVWQQVGPLHSRKFCDTSLCKCQPHPIRWSRDAIAHKGMPPIKFYICHWVQFFIFILLFFHLFQGNFIQKIVVGASTIQFSGRQRFVSC